MRRRRIASRPPALRLLLLALASGITLCASGSGGDFGDAFGTSSTAVPFGDVAGNLELGLIARWSFARAATYAVAFDTSGSSKHLLLRRALPGSPYPGLAARRSITLLGHTRGAWALLPPQIPLLIETAWTLTAWICLAPDSIGDGSFVAWKDGLGPVLLLRFDAGRLTAAYRANITNASEPLQPSASPPGTSFDVRDGVFHHVAVVFQYGELNYYVDGSFVGREVVPFPAPWQEAAATRLSFGGLVDDTLADPADGLDLSLGETRLYARALPLAELQLLAEGVETVEDDGVTPIATCSWAPDFEPPPDPLPALYLLAPTHAWLESRCGQMLLDDGVLGNGHFMFSAGSWLSTRVATAGGPRGSFFLRLSPGTSTSIAPAPSVGAAASFELSASETRLIWVRTAANDTVQTLFAYGDGRDNNLHALRLVNGVPQVYVAAGNVSAESPLPPGVNVADNAWHFIALVRTADVVEIYADNFRIVRHKLPSLRPTVTRLDLGASVSGGLVHDLFAGDLDSARIYDTALTLAEMGDLAVGIEVLRVPPPTTSTLAPTRSTSADVSLTPAASTYSCSVPGRTRPDVLRLGLFVFAVLLAGISLVFFIIVAKEVSRGVKKRRAARRRAARSAVAPILSPQDNSDALADGRSLPNSRKLEVARFRQENQSPQLAALTKASTLPAPSSGANAVMGVNKLSTVHPSLHDAQTSKYTIAVDTALSSDWLPVIAPPLRLPRTLRDGASTQFASETPRESNLILTRYSPSQRTLSRINVTGRDGQRGAVEHEPKAVLGQSHSGAAQSVSGTLASTLVAGGGYGRIPSRGERLLLVLWTVLTVGMLVSAAIVLALASQADGALTEAVDGDTAVTTLAYQLPTVALRQLYDSPVALRVDMVDNALLVYNDSWAAAVGVEQTTPVRDTRWLETGCSAQVQQTTCYRAVMDPICAPGSPPEWAPRNGTLVAAFKSWKGRASACDADFGTYSTLTGQGCGRLCCEGE